MDDDTKKIIAEKFGQFLDQDDYAEFKRLLEPNCVYEIGDKIYNNSIAIAGLYEKNMKEGKLKFDELVWEESEIKPVSESEYDVYFSDYLKHKGVEHHYKCKQRVTVNDSHLVEKIIHIELPGERKKLLKFYKQVGLQ